MGSWRRDCGSCWGSDLSALQSSGAPGQKPLVNGLNGNSGGQLARNSVRRLARKAHGSLDLAWRRRWTLARERVGELLDEGGAEGCRSVGRHGEANSPSEKENYTPIS